MKILKHLKSDWFRYGFETIAVIIGILAAFALDNWNRERKDREEELAYLKRYYLDLKQDSIYLNQNILTASLAQDSIKNFLNLLPQEQHTARDVFTLIFIPNWEATELILQDYTFRDITSSGKFDLIRDPLIKEALIDYYRSYEFVRKHIAEMTSTGLSFFMEVYPHLARYFNYENFSEYEIFDRKDWNWINEPSDLRYKQIEASAIHYRYKFTISEGYYLMLLYKAEHLLQLLSEAT